MSGGLQAQTAIVTGAANGIGLATARALAAAGARVVVVDNSDRTVDVASDIGGEPLVADLGDPGAVAEIVAAVVDLTGQLDIVINNAGLARHNAVTDIEVDDLDLMWAVNARATMILCRDALRHMAGRGGGQIVNVVSTAGLRGGPGEAVYCATKAAVRAFTEGLVEEARLVGVRVHGIYPAGVDTSFWSEATRSGPGVNTAAAFLRAEDVASAIVSVLASANHVHFPELVLRAVADGDVEATRRKLEWFTT